MNVATLNVRNNPDMARPLVRECAAEAKKVAGVVGFQEIGEDEDHRDLRSVFGDRFSWSNTNSETPQTWPEYTWRKARPDELPEGVTVEGKLLLHHGKAKTSPNRYLVWVCLVRIDKNGGRTSLAPQVFANTHWVSGAWSPRPTLNKGWRKEMWTQGWFRSQTQIRAFNAKGLSVLFRGDLNRSAVQKFTETQAWVARAGIDWIAFCPAPRGNRFRVKYSDTRKTPSDHPLLFVNGTISPFR